MATANASMAAAAHAAMPTAASALRPQGRGKNDSKQSRAEKPRPHAAIIPLSRNREQPEHCKSFE
jgi:hypothetical protein